MSTAPVLANKDTVDEDAKDTVLEDASASVLAINETPINAGEPLFLMSPHLLLTASMRVIRRCIASSRIC
jgi:hypothetical protein